MRSASSPNVSISGHMFSMTCPERKSFLWLLRSARFLRVAVTCSTYMQQKLHSLYRWHDIRITILSVNVFRSSYWPWHKFTVILRMKKIHFIQDPYPSQTQDGSHSRLRVSLEVPHLQVLRSGISRLGHNRLTQCYISDEHGTFWKSTLQTLSIHISGCTVTDALRKMLQPVHCNARVKTSWRSWSDQLKLLMCTQYVAHSTKYKWK